MTSPKNGSLTILRILTVATVVALTVAVPTRDAPANEHLQLAQAAGDPLILQAVREIERYEGLADAMAPGDKTAGRQYLDALAGIGRRLSAVVNKNQPGWREAAERFNALQKRVADIANQPAAAAAPGAPQAPAATAQAPRLISSDQARLNRISGNIQSLGRQVDGAQFQSFLDARELAGFRNAAANQRNDLGGLPAEHPDVAVALRAVEELDRKIDARVAEAQAKAGAVGDVDAQLAAIDSRIQSVPVPPVQDFKPDGGAAAAGAYARALVTLLAQSFSDMATLDKIAGAGFRDQRIERLRHWAGAERQRQIAENLNAAKQRMDSHVGRYLEVAAFQANTDPANRDHVANRLLGEGRRETTLAEFDAGIAAVETAKAFDAGMSRKDAPDRAAQAKLLTDGRESFEAKYKTALAGSRMPAAGMSDDKYIAVAREVLVNPNYDVNRPYRRMVINSQSVQRHEKREADINPGVVTTTVAIYTWEWDEYQVATAEKVGDEFYVFYNTLKFFHRGAPTTPTGKWVLSDRFKGTRILEENIEK